MALGPAAASNAMLRAAIALIFAITMGGVLQQDFWFCDDINLRLGSYKANQQHDHFAVDDRVRSLQGHSGRGHYTTRTGGSPSARQPIRGRHRKRVLHV